MQSLLNNNVKIYDVKYTDYNNMQEFYIFDKPQTIRYGNYYIRKLPHRMFITVDVNGKKYKIPTDYYDEFKEKAYLSRSRRRGLSNYFGYAYMNKWKYFITLTFDPAFVDRWSYEDCYKKLNEWVKYKRRNLNGDFKMLAVSEFHKDGAVHFHALVDCDMSDDIFDGCPAKDSIFSWGLGFSDIKLITGDCCKLVNYISKYIMKQDKHVGHMYHKFGSLNSAVSRYTSISIYDDYIRQMYDNVETFVKHTKLGIVIKIYSFVRPRDLNPLYLVTADTLGNKKYTSFSNSTEIQKQCEMNLS